MNNYPQKLNNSKSCCSTCRQPGCTASIVEDTIRPVQCGAGLRLYADCRMGHKTSYSTCEFINKGRTSIIDVKISVMQLVIGMNMTQECQQRSVISACPRLSGFSHLFISIEILHVCRLYLCGI